MRCVFVSLLVLFGEFFTGEEFVMWSWCTLKAPIENLLTNKLRKLFELQLMNLKRWYHNSHFSGRHLIDEAENEWETVSCWCFMVLQSTSQHKPFQVNKHVLPK